MARRILVVVAHPDLSASKVNRTMVEAISGLDGVSVAPLYERYPEFRIDVPREQRACLEHDVIVLQHPLFWYSCPSLMKEWIDRVLTRGWAYGTGGTALQGKAVLSAVSSNADLAAYSAVGKNRHSIDDLLAPFRQTAWHCGMHYLAPFVFYGARVADRAQIAAHAGRYRDLLRDLQTRPDLLAAPETILPADRVDFS